MKPSEETSFKNIKKSSCFFYYNATTSIFKYFEVSSSVNLKINHNRYVPVTCLIINGTVS